MTATDPTRKYLKIFEKIVATLMALFLAQLILSIFFDIDNKKLKIFNLNNFKESYEGRIIEKLEDQYWYKINTSTGYKHVYLNTNDVNIGDYLKKESCSEFVFKMNKASQKQLIKIVKE